MNPVNAQELLNHLQSQAMGLDDLLARARGYGSPWTRAQLQLFLRCAPGIEVDPETEVFRGTAAGGDDALQAAVIDAVRSFAGRPVPAAQVRTRLPNEFITTDEQILAIARRTPKLEVFGPNLIRIAP